LNASLLENVQYYSVPNFANDICLNNISTRARVQGARVQGARVQGARVQECFTCICQPPLTQAKNIFIANKTE